jgi:1-acyl-sn-glycerol-3-phosphate acyltransferase
VLGLPLSLLLCFPLVSSLQLMQFPLLSPLLLSLSLWLMSLLLLLLLLLWRRRLVQVLERAWQVCPHLEKGKSGKQ